MNNNDENLKKDIENLRKEIDGIRKLGIYGFFALGGVLLIVLFSPQIGLPIIAIGLLSTLILILIVRVVSSLGAKLGLWTSNELRNTPLERSIKSVISDKNAEPD